MIIVAAVTGMVLSFGNLAASTVTAGFGSTGRMTG